MRVVLNDWKLIDYYIDQTLDYCRRSHILSEYEISHLKIERIAKHQGKKPFQSFSRNLSDSVYSQSELHKLLIDYFHEGEFFNSNGQTEVMVNLRSQNTNKSVQPILTGPGEVDNTIT